LENLKIQKVQFLTILVFNFSRSNGAWYQRCICGKSFRPLSWDIEKKRESTL